MQKFLLKFVTIKLILSLLILPQASQASLNAQDLPAYNEGIAQYHHLDAAEKEEIKTNMRLNGGNFTMAAAKFFDEHPLRAPGLPPAVLLQIQQLQMEKAGLEAECRRLGQCDREHSRRIEQLTQEIEAKDTRIAAAEAARQRAEAGMARLQGLLKAAEAGRAGAVAELNRHQKEIEQLRKDEATLRQRIAALEEEQQRLQRQLRDARRSTGDAGKEVVQLQSQIDSLVREKGALQAEVKQLDEFLGDIARVAGVRGVDHKAKKDAIIGEITRLQQQAEAAMAESQRLGQNLHQALSDGRTKDQELQRYRTHVEQLMAHIQQLEAQLRQTGNQAGVSVGQVAEAQAVIAKLKKTNEELEKCLVRLARVAGVEVGGADLESRKRIEDLTSQTERAIMDLRRQIDQLHTRNQAEAQRVQGLLSQTTTQGQATTEALRKAQQDIQDLLGQNQELQEALRREQGAAQQKLRELKKREQEVDGLNAREVESEDALRRIQANEAQLQRQIKALAVENDTLKRDMAQLIKLAQAVAGFVGQNTRQRINVDALIEGLTKKKQEFDAIARRANTAEEELGRSQHELIALTSRLGAEKDNTTTIQRLNDEKTRMAKDVDALRSALDEMFMEKQRIELERRKLEERLQKTQIQIRELQEDNDEAIQQLGKMSNLERSNGYLNQNIQEKDEEIRQLKLEAKRLKSALSETQETSRYQHLTDLTKEHLNELERLRLRIQSTQERLRDVIRQGSTVDADSLSGNITHTQQVLTDMQTLASKAIDKLTPYISDYSPGESLLSSPGRGGAGRLFASPRTPRRQSFSRSGSMNQSYDGSWNG
jgi:chromosome segregation ATPase